jgi:ubiquinone/menaquinone biosynthesis C-methylase UbiE
MSSESIVFDPAAGYYDETRGFAPGVEGPAIAAMVRAGEFAPDSRILEVGIGTGRIALPLAAHVRSVTGVDLSRGMIDRLLAKRDDQAVYPVLADATRLPLPTNAFEGAVAVHIFHLIPAWQTALQEVARALKPDGRLVSAYYDQAEKLSPVHELLSAAWDEAVGRDRMENVGVPRARYGTFLTEEGWRQVGEPQVYEYTQTRTPREHVRRMEQRVWSQCWRLPDEVVVRGATAMREAAARAGIDLDAPFEVPSTFKAVAYLPPEG